MPPEVYEIINAGSGCPYGEASVNIFDVYNSRIYLDDYQAGHGNYHLLDFWQYNGTSAQIWCVI